MGGGPIYPEGYTQKGYRDYGLALIDKLKNGKDSVTVCVVDSRGNISKSVVELEVGFYSPPTFSELEAIRVNDIDTQTRLKGTGKCYALYPVNYIKYTVSTAAWVDGSTSGTTYGPFTIPLSEITYNTDNTEFTINSLIQGDLGTNGFTKGQKFYLKIEIADTWNYSYPFIYYAEVKTGNILMSHADTGVAFGADYDENLGGPLQINGSRVDLIYSILDQFTD